MLLFFALLRDTLRHMPCFRITLCYAIIYAMMPLLLLLPLCRYYAYAIDYRCRFDAAYFIC